MSPWRPELSKLDEIVFLLLFGVVFKSSNGFHFGVVFFRNNPPFETAFHWEWLRNNPKGPHGPVPPRAPKAPLGPFGSLWVPLGPVGPLGSRGFPWVPPPRDLDRVGATKERLKA